MLDLDLISRVAAALKTDESFIEKDWHVVRALGVIASVEVDGVHPVFSGGTSLAKGWGLIRRFSEDIDFKVGVVAASNATASKLRTAFRHKIVEAMEAANFTLEGEPLVGNQSLFFRALFNYGAQTPVSPGLRPGLQIEMTFEAPVRTPASRPIQSLLGLAQKSAPEIAGYLCVDPIETAADKLSALSWRTHVRDRASDKDDPTIVRHLHDLAALADTVKGDITFAELARSILVDDAKRAKDPKVDGPALLRAMLPKITSDAMWRVEYERFVALVSYAPDDELITFDKAVDACQGLVEKVLRSA